MILKKIMILVFLVGAMFTINSLRVQATSMHFEDCGNENNLFATEGPCCIPENQGCPDGDRSCCKGLTCKEKTGLGYNTCQP